MEAPHPSDQRPTRFLAPGRGGSVAYTTFESMVGELLLVSDGEALTGLYMEITHHGPPRLGPDWRLDRAAFKEATDQLAAYFAGELRTFDLPLAPTGSPFQLAVWEALLDIGYGETASYGEVATAIGRRGAGRAVGAANGANPISLVVPCHRVIGANGSLTGYGGGIERKEILLALERTNSTPVD